MFAFFNIGAQEMVILLILCALVVGAGIFAYLVTRSSKDRDE
jgi:hypothetical protein